MPQPVPSPRPSSPLLSLAVIAAVVGCVALAFAYTAGWLSPQRLTPERLVDALRPPSGEAVGHRRNHAKGICFTGVFEANGAGAALSTAQALASGQYPVVGRFAIGTADPNAADATARVRSMAIRIATPDGQEWRSGMNDIPFFPVPTPQAFYELLIASRPDPATGKPDPAAMQRFAAANPEIGPFGGWAASAPWTASYADERYNGLNAFVFVDASGAEHAVRWSMLPTVPATAVSPEDLAKRAPDFLEQDLRARLASGPLRWTMVVTVANPGDPTADATKAWPEDRRAVTVGTLTVQRAEAEADGPCREINYDPLVLPSGIRPSDDPLLPARSSGYADSYDRRTAEAAAYPRTPSTETRP